MSSSAPKTRELTEEILARFDATREARGLLAPGLGPSEFVSALLERELWADAAGFVGQWLGKVDAVTWACLASKKALAPDAPKEERAALEAAERWAKAPGEEARRACAAAAEALTYGSAPAMAAAAAGWSGGSLSLPDLPPVPPPANLTGTGAAGAVLMSAAAGAPDVAGRLRELVWLGVGLAEGRRRPAAGGREEPPRAEREG